MKPQYLFTSLCCLGGLLISGCTAVPESAATAPATRTVSETATPATVLPANTPLAAAVTATLLPNSTSVPIEAPMLPAAAVRQTQAALIAIYTPIPSKTPTPTFTPGPTSTPFTGAIRPILFAGIPCVPGHSYCTDHERFEPMQWYQVYSDGSGFRSVDQLENPDMVIQRIRFSPDGSLMAYWAASAKERHLFLADLSNKNPIELVVVPAEQGALMQGFDFMPETDCLVVWWSDVQQATEFETVSVEQVCPGQAKPLGLGVFELPFRSGSYLLSPQGDAFLAYSRDRDQNLQLYIQEIDVTSPPFFLFTSEDDLAFLSPRRWRPDGQAIEFILNRYHSPSYDQAAITKYVVSRDGQTVESYPLVEDAPFGLCCDWSPDGREIVIALLDRPSEINGIYVFNLEDASWRQILPGFQLDRGPIWSPEMP